MDHRLYAEEHGNGGPLLLLIHGLAGGVSSWAKVAEILAAHHRVLIPDLLGFGRSPWPDVQYTIDDHLAALERLLEDRDLGSEVLDIAGHSMGAVLAAEFAARHPGQVGQVTLVSLPYFHSAAEIHERAARMGPLARLTVSENWAARATCYAMCALRPLLVVPLPRIARRLPRSVVRDALQHNFSSISRSLQNVIIKHRPDVALSTLADRHLLLVHGDEDRAAPLENVRDLVARFPSWRLEVLAGAGHLLPIEWPDRVAELLGASCLSRHRERLEGASGLTNEGRMAGRRDGSAINWPDAPSMRSG